VLCSRVHGTHDKSTYAHVQYESSISQQESPPHTHAQVHTQTHPHRLYDAMTNISDHLLTHMCNVNISYANKTRHHSCARAHTHTRIRTHTHTHTHTSTRTHTHALTHTHTHTHTHRYYDDRVMDIEDDLPKYKGSTRHELWVPRKDNPQESVEETREQ